MRIPFSIAASFLSGACVLLLAAMAGAQQGATKPDAGPEPAPPANQTYIGVSKCASCHFDKRVDWMKQQDKHKKAFEVLPAKYQEDPACLKCHSTGFGEATGFHTAAAEPNLAGVTCEACHGPGSAHAEIAKTLPKTKLSPEQDKIARDSIYKMLPQNVCVSCHTNRSHKKHPDYEKAQ